VRRALGFILATVLFVGSPAASDSLATTARCSVENVRTGAITHSLQAAVGAARADDRLHIRGTCVGRTAIVKTRLHLKGIPTASQPVPTLDGAGVSRVLVIRDARVWARNLAVTNGLAAYGYSLAGGAIWNGGGQLTLSGSTSVTRSVAPSPGDGSTSRGGGVFNYWGGRLVLADSSSVSGNTADQGGGVFSFGMAILKGSASITGNMAVVGGGIDVPSGDGVYVCTDRVTISPNEPDDPPQTYPCPPSR
jgi:hypothetical protein